MEFWASFFCSNENAIFTLLSIFSVFILVCSFCLLVALAQCSCVFGISGERERAKWKRVDYITVRSYLATFRFISTMCVYFNIRMCLSTCRSALKSLDVSWKYINNWLICFHMFTKICAPIHIIRNIWPLWKGWHHNGNRFGI